MSRPLVVVCCVGLTPAHLGSDTPQLTALAERGFAAPMSGVVPAVTTSAQATLVTGVLPQEHGIVGNGWHLRDLGEVLFWRQSQRLIQAPSAWEIARRTRPALRVLKHFWWYAMHSDCDAAVTPRPVYHHDGRKSPDIYAWPTTLKDAITARHGTFPLFSFWGPTAGIASTQWIADSFATAQAATQPDLALVYLPHLDYDLQRFGPTGAHLSGNLRALDAAAGTVITAAAARGADVLVVSEYGISAVDHPVEINRALRQAGLLSVSRNAAGELIDIGTSTAFAVCDHQIAHVSCANPAGAERAARLLRGLPGIARVLAGHERAEIGLDHPRAGELVCLAAPGAWFVYDYWLDPAAAPDFARCVEIHKKPGYDPRELYFDPQGGRLRAARALLRKKLGLRYVMDPCPLDARLVRGSHGLAAENPEHGPILIGSDRRFANAEASSYDMREVCPLIVRLLTAS